MSLNERISRRLVRRRLEGLERGALTVREAGSEERFGPGDAGAEARVRILDPRFYPAVAWGGHVGAAEAYAEGWWETDDLTSVVRVFLQNREALEHLEQGSARLVQPARWLYHALNRNTRSGSRRNIAAHYDMGNEFFQLFLDETLTYSCGVFEHPDSTMEEASIAKYDRLCRKLGLQDGDHIVEIGTGWGGFALHAATRYGARVTTTTISRRQYELARERIQTAGLGERVDVRFSDYRDLDGEYDKLVSIEMLEAVGHQYFPAYFDTCARLLKPDGLAAIQVITIQDQYYEAARRETDFIKRYIFPGSCIPSVPVLMEASRPTGLRVVHAEDIGEHYPRTLRTWAEGFVREAERIAQLGLDAFQRRMWQFYFAYCEGGFTERALGVHQMVFAKPGAEFAFAESRQDP